MVVGWVLVAVIVFGMWRFLRAIRRQWRQLAENRSEAFSNAVSDAVAHGVAQALAAAVADATATASGGNVNVHIGDNLARLIADNYDDALRPSTDESDDAIARRPSMGSVSDGARRRELASRRPIRRGNNDRTNGGDIRESSIPRSELEQ